MHGRRSLITYTHSGNNRRRLSTLSRIHRIVEAKVPPVEERLILDINCAHMARSRSRRHPLHLIGSTR
jgi:hypothetical protein